MNLYSVENVSLGYDYSSIWGNIIAGDGTIVYFANNHIQVSRIDERNLTLCKYLNLCCSAISYINVNYLRSLRVFIIWGSKI